MAKRNKRAYLENFQKDENGNYCYIGEYCSWVSPKDKSAHTKKLWLSCIIMLAFILCTGCLPSMSQNNALFIIIFILELISFVFIMMGMLKLPQGESVREYIYKRHIAKLPNYAKLVSINASILLLVEAYVILRNLNGSDLLMDTLVFASQTAVLLAAVNFHRQFAIIKWKASAK